MKHLHFLRGNRKPQHSLLGVAFLPLFMLSAAVFVGCDQESPVSAEKQFPAENLSEAGTQETDSQAINFRYQGKLYTNEEFQRIFEGKEFPIMVAGDGLPEANIVYVFDSEADFNSWAKTTALAEKFAQREKLISERTAIDFLAESSGETTLEKSSSVNGSATLYEHTYYNYYVRGRSTTGRSGQVANNLALAGLDRKVSSVRITTCLGVTICELYAGLNLTGTRKVLSFLSAACPGTSTSYYDLSRYNFNDRARSAAVY